ncbi:hypothetical protein JI747_018815 [Chryseobacterium sp. RG1]|uniref:Lipoprotein n=1 Tax=Chryseobacterium tagetis TaxID=2801334 RepID=A0ABS8A5H3_9FLAO|nr:hypothetical protein [Chryseobacterium tagetis]MCA6069223.1 hypothetical protein [Chryseobacterium tagetis]
MKYTVIIIVFLFVGSCQKKDALPELEKNEEKIITMNSVSNYDSIIRSVKLKGDTLAYNELYYYLMDSNKNDRTDTLMYYSQIMAEKYNYDLAYFYYLTALCEKYNISFKDANYSAINITSMNKLSKKEIENWLNKMLEKKVITKEQYNSVKR